LYSLLSRPTNAKHIYVKVKGNAVPLQAWGGAEGSRKLRFLDFMTTAQDGGKAYTPADFTPRKYAWYSFLLEAESTAGP
jgi:hypothetical protein